MVTLYKSRTFDSVSSIGFSVNIDIPACAAAVISDACVGVGVEIIIPSSFVVWVVIASFSD